MKKSKLLNKIIFGYLTPTNLDDEIFYKELQKMNLVGSDGGGGWNAIGPVWNKYAFVNISDATKINIIAKLEKLNLNWFDEDDTPY
jgi:hypothetical protein